MKRKFTEKAITQPVEYADNKRLRGGAGDGYIMTLKKSYMNGVKQHMESGKKAEKVIIVAPNDYVAYQATAVMTRGYDTNIAMDNKSLYAYGTLGKKADTERMISLIDLAAICGEKNLQQNPLVMAIESISGMPRGNAEQLSMEDVVFVAAGNSGNEAAEINVIKNIDKDTIYVWVKDYNANKHMIDLLCFEEDYKVIRVGNPEFEDYKSYALDYLEYHGFSAREEDVEVMLRDLLRFRKGEMNEEDIYIHLDRCLKKAVKDKIRVLDLQHIQVSYGCEESVNEELNRVIGLEKVKDRINRICSTRKLIERHCKNSGSKPLHNNCILQGPPGVGKSMMAELLAKKLAELNLSNGKYVSANRSEVIGQYLGQTAPKVRELFDKADGGVLFIDEAGFLNDRTAYTNEAVVEFVRYMEMRPQTMVIFATYPEEADKLLERDPGLSSRISQIINFESYSDGELYQIMEGMAKSFGFELESGCFDAMKDYIDVKKNLPNYGNAREVRKLFETALEECAVRCDGENDGKIIAADVIRAAKYLNVNNTGGKTIGFN